MEFLSEGKEVKEIKEVEETEDKNWPVERR
jgi:hypothetical protein